MYSIYILYTYIHTIHIYIEREYILKYVVGVAVFIETNQFVNISLLVVKYLITPRRQVVKINIPPIGSFCLVWEAKLHRTKQ